MHNNKLIMLYKYIDMDIKKIICSPALTFLIVALLLTCIATLISLNLFGLITFSSQFITILCCTLILMGIYNIAPEVSWVLAIIFILCSISGLVAIISGMMTTSPNLYIERQ
jgi:hypothetical protein